MALIGSLDSGVNAMQSFVKGMEVIGDNIANSKTVGFKRQRVNYTDNFSNTLRDATPGTGDRSNLPPIQVGAGVSITAAQKLFGQGSIELTGVSSDLAISGEGFFRVYDVANQQQLLTRDGSFRVDENGFLADKNGNFLLGLTGGTAETDPNVIGKVQISLADDVKVDNQDRPIDGTGPADFPNDAVILTDLSGSPARALLHNDGNYYLVNDAGNYIDGDGNEIGGGTPVPFDLDNPTGAVEWNSLTQPFAVAGSAEAAEGVWDPASPDPAVATPDPSDPNQFPLAVQNWTINKDGELRLTLNDGSSYVRGQVLLQQIQDQDALTEEGSGLYSGMVNAGAVGMLDWNLGSTMADTDRTAHLPNQSGVGFIQSRALEGSNTDLTQEFADMITTQRAFQAGSKVISVSDEMLQEIINLKR
jgi:flagellar hook protein FlgE